MKPAKIRKIGVMTALIICLSFCLIPLPLCAEDTDLLSLDGKTPNGWQETDTANPYGHGLNEAFMMAPQNELLSYICYNNDSSDRHKEVTVFKNFNTGAVNSNNIAKNKMAREKNPAADRSAFSDYDTDTMTQNMKIAHYVEAVAFDATGSGRKDHVAYVGYRAVEDGTTYNDIVIWVANANTGRTSVRYHVADVGVFAFKSDGKATLEPFYAANFFAITAGRYRPGVTDPDTGITTKAPETFVIFVPGAKCRLEEWEAYYVNAGTDQEELRLRRVSGDDANGFLHNLYINNNSGKTMAASDKKNNMLSASLTTGDFNGDGIDDLAALSYLNRPESKYYGLATDFFKPQLAVAYGGGNGSILTKTPAKEYVGGETIREEDASIKSEMTPTLRSPSVAAGNIDTDSADEIIIGGYASGIIRLSNHGITIDNDPYARNDKATVAAYNFSSNALQQILYTDYDEKSGVMNKYTKEIINKHNDDIMPVFAVDTVAIDGAANRAYIFLNGTFCRLKTDGKNVEAKFTPTYFTKWHGKAGEMDSISRNYIRATAAGVYDGNSVGREQLAIAVGVKESSEDDYAFILGVCGGRDYADAADNKGNIQSYGRAQKYFSTGFDENSDYGKNKNAFDVYNKGSKVKQLLNCTIAAVDTGNDGTLARYTGKTYAYSNPHIVAVLQAAPYFQNLNHPGETGYKFSVSYTTTDTVTESASYSVGVVAEAAAPGIKVSVGSGYTGGWSESFEASYTKEYGETYTAMNDNSVIMRRTPIFMYCYDIQDANGEWIANGGQGAIQVAVPQKPIYAQLNVDEYNDFVDDYNAELKEGNEKDLLTDDRLKAAMLKPIAAARDKTGQKHYGSLIGNAGDPSAYASAWDQLAGCTVVSNTSQTLSKDGGKTMISSSGTEAFSESTTNTEGYYFDASICSGGSAGYVEAWAGVSAHSEGSVSYGQTTTKASTQEISGTVNNLDKSQFEPKMLDGYGFYWEFGTWNIDLLPHNGEAVPVLGYVVNNLSNGVATPKNLRAEQGGDKSTVVLNWDEAAGAVAYHLYIYDHDGKATRLNDAPITDTTYSYTLPANNAPSFLFAVTAIKDNGYESLPSARAVFYRDFTTVNVSAITRAENGDWLITYSDGSTETIGGLSVISVTMDKAGTWIITYSDGTVEKLQSGGQLLPVEGFKDVDLSQWYLAAVNYVLANGLMKGVSDDVFAPDITTTRAMIVTILYRHEGAPAVKGGSPFNDVKAGQWYTEAVTWANENHIVDGYGQGKFGPGDDITREQFMSIMYRYAKFKGYDVSKTAELSSYRDTADISDWALPALKWAKATELITGRTADTLIPKGNATRAEAAMILMRFIENIK